MSLKRTLAGAAAGLALTLGLPAAASAQTDVKFVLDWALQGNHSIFTVALDKGYFAKEGLKVTMDRGFGSGDTIIKVASGAYDIGFGDVNGLVKFNAENPTKSVISFLQIFDNTLASIVTLKSKNIAKPQDLAGKTLAAPDGEGSRLLFPAFARANKLDPASVKWLSVTPQMRETLLVQGQTDAITAFISTAYFNIKGAGVDPSQIVSMPYGEYGLDLYGNGLLATSAYMEKNPKVLEGFTRAVIAGWRDVLADHKAAIASLKKRDALLNDQLELDRLQLVLDKAMLTPFVKANGFGTVVPERMARGVLVNAEAFGVANPPAPEAIYTTKFLPPAAERMP